MLKCLLLFVLLVGGTLQDEITLGPDDVIDVDISTIDSPLIDIVWCGSDKNSDDNVLVLSSKGSIYRSKDKGHSWFKMSEVFHRKALLQAQDSEVKVGVVNKIQRNPIDLQMVLFLGTEGINWISPDCGKTINAIGAERQLREFQFHPKDKNQILAASWSKCPPKSETKCFSTKDLMLSQDMGITWTKLASYVSQFAWGARNHSPNIPEERILIAYEPNGSGHQKLSGWNMKTHLYFSDDYMKTKTIVVNQGNKFLLTNNFLFVAQVMSSTNQEVTLMVADSTVDRYQFQYVQLPETLREHSYTILDASEGQVFLNINHLKPSSPMGSIYISDSTGTRFSLSLDHNVRTEEGQCDFEKILGLEGIYLANVYHKEQAILYQSQYEEDSEIPVETDRTGVKIVKDNELSRFKQTRITFDKGGIWEPLKPPERDSQDNKINCELPNCSLHLHSVSTKLQYGPLYSTAQSVGLIMGTGNVGKYLSYRPDLVNTYLSRDGGLNWFEVAKGSHIYEIGDHGGLIVLADDQMATTTLYYSWNEGLHWWRFEVSDRPIEITNIITEPSNTATRFIVYGVEQKKNEDRFEQGVVITIDFDHLHTRTCEGIENPGEATSDYEEWSPNGKINPECLMGKKVTYIRRKRDSQCWNGEDMERIKYVEKCTCTDEDWECDLGFHRENGVSPCIRDSNVEELEYSPPAECNDFYTISQGYRKVAGNVCENGVQHQPIKLPCPGFRPFKMNSVWDIALIFIFVAIVYFVYQNRDICLKKSQPPKATKKSTQLNELPTRDNEEGLGYREFDEELLEESVKSSTVSAGKLFAKQKKDPNQEIL